MERSESTKSDHRGPWLQCFSGIAFHPTDPHPDEVSVIDIAHHLALLNRFCGATRVPMSVAQHSVGVARVVAMLGGTRIDRLAGLLHDAAEAYCNDLIRPVKHHESIRGPYQAIERRIADVIADRFRIQRGLFESRLVVQADEILLATEKRDLLTTSTRAWGLTAQPLPERIESWPWEQAKANFLEAFYELSDVA